ncbi:hypothetical protein JCM11491_003486 [Sporobolomyces phaffii]
MHESDESPTSPTPSRHSLAELSSLDAPSPNPGNVYHPPLLSSDNELGHGAEPEQAITRDLARIAAVAGLGGLLFGFDTGVISGALLSLKRDPAPLLPLSTGQESFLVSSALVGALCASVFAGTLADSRLGRKGVIILSSVLFTVGAAEMAAAQVYKEIILGRVLVGFGVGLASCVLPTYLAELSPPKYRGTIVASLVVLITAGQVLAYVVDALFASAASGWRWMLGAGIVPGLSQLVLSFALPESPRHLLRRGKTARGRRVVKRLNPTWTSERVQLEVERLEHEVGARARGDDDDDDGRVRLPPSLGEGDQTPRWFERLKSVGQVDWRAKWAQAKRARERWQGLTWDDTANRKTLIVACGLQFFQQSTGFNCLMYYSTRVIEQTHLSSPATFALLIAISNFVCTLVALRLIDRTGRRQLLLRGLIGMIVGMVILSASFAFIPRTVQRDSSGTAQRPRPAAIVSLFGMTVFCCAYALSLGNVPWVVQSEVFVPELKSLGTSLATAANWSSNIVISSSFLHISQGIGPSGAFGLLAIICAIAWAFTYLLLPETKGLSLDEVRGLFELEGSSTSIVGKSQNGARGRLLDDGGTRDAGGAGYHVVGDEDGETDDDGELDGEEQQQTRSGRKGIA